MTKQEKTLWSLLGGILILLFLLSSTDWIIKEKKNIIYPVSLILGDTSDDYYGNFKKGVDKAAEEYNVDVSFITLYEKGDVSQQIDLVKREVADGAAAVVLIPVKPEACAKAMDTMALDSPVIIMGNQFPCEGVAGGIAPDYEEQGRILGRAIASENSSELPVLIFSRGLSLGYGREIYSGLVSVLTEAGFETRLIESETEETFRQTIEASVYPGSGMALLAAVDVDSLNSAADIIAGSPVYGHYIKGVYGIGSTTKLLNQLDAGIIRGMVVNDQFDAGYLSIEKAVEAIRGGPKKEQTILESYYIQKSSLRENRLEKILYPID